MEATIDLFGEISQVKVETNTYLNGGTAMLLTENGMPYATISVWLPYSPQLPEGVFYVKDWTENEPMVAQLIEQGILEKITGEGIPIGTSGHITNIYPYRLTNKS